LLKNFSVSERSDVGLREESALNQNHRARISILSEAELQLTRSYRFFARRSGF
jgi:hypothetical protein